MRSEIPDRELERKRAELPESRRFIVLLFNGGNQVLLRRGPGSDSAWRLSASGTAAAGQTLEDAAARVAGDASAPVFIFNLESSEGDRVPVFFAAAPEEGEGEADETSAFFSIEEIRRGLFDSPADFAPEVSAVLEKIGPHIARIPYLQKGEHDYNYRFRPEKLRNRAVYQADERSRSLYQSALCQAIKEVKRVNERSSNSPAVLDFGAVSYVLPSHFGFCLGVQNAIERAYECLAENPGKTVYMLSELIHNPFVNEDLRARGLRYLQSDKGRPLIDPDTGVFFWDLLRKDDVVVIPAFGATDEDKARLVEKGIAINRYDATCMLVEKVWKAAQRFGKEGYTVIIHGKAEHEETKATFSNAARAGAALIVRNMEEAERLGAIILSEDPDEKRRLFETFAGQHTSGMDPVRDLDRLAVVNQTTLLRNETLHIIGCLEKILVRKFGSENLSRHLNSNSKGDTLCYATQVNQDALQKALAMEIDLAFVAGGKNSSNTYQLFRMCQERLGGRAFYIQSEKNILPDGSILHYRFNPGASPDTDDMEKRPPVLDSESPMRILLTGGASCPDGVIQQIIARTNSFFLPETMRPVAEVLDDLQAGAR